MSETCPAKVRRVQSWFWRGPCGSCVGPGASPHVLAALLASVMFWSLLLSGPSPACRLPTCSGAPVPRTGVRAGGQIQLLPAQLARQEAVASSCITHTDSESSRSNPSLVPQPQPTQPSFRWVLAVWTLGGHPGAPLPPTEHPQQRAEPPPPAHRVGARLQATGCSRKWRHYAWRHGRERQAFVQV